MDPVLQEWMDQAFDEAEKALARGEVPIGAVVVLDKTIVGRGHNLIETLQEPTAHAEMLAITAAAQAIGTWRLNGAALYVTLEPCPMCMGAIHLARLDRLVYAAADPRLGACGSMVDLSGLSAMRAPVEIEADMDAARSAALLQRFFKNLRGRKDARK